MRFSTPFVASDERRCAEAHPTYLPSRGSPAGRPGLYELRVGDNHHHIVCRSCEAVVDVECAVGETPCLSAADNSGYVIDEAEVIFWGRCPECYTRTVREEMDGRV